MYLIGTERRLEVLHQVDQPFILHYYETSVISQTQGDYVHDYVTVEYYRFIPYYLLLDQAN
jgi:hypothetical protein